MHLNRIQDLKGCAVYFKKNNVQGAGRGYAPVATYIHLPPRLPRTYTILYCYAIGNHNTPHRNIGKMMPCWCA